MGKFRIDWKATTQYVGTEATVNEGEEFYETREEAEAAKAEMDADPDTSKEVWQAAVEHAGVEGWLEIVEMS